MSNLRSLKKPKKHKKNIGYVILAVAAIAVIALGIVLLSRGGKCKVPNAEIRTEVVQKIE